MALWLLSRLACLAIAHARSDRLLLSCYLDDIWSCLAAEPDQSRDFAGAADMDDVPENWVCPACRQAQGIFPLVMPGRQEVRG